MKLNLDLSTLALFRTPICAYDLLQKRKGTYSAWHQQTKKLKALGLIEHYKDVLSIKNMCKILYKITEKGDALLNLFDE